MSDKNNNEAIKAAKKVLQDISNDEREIYLAELREKHIRDQKAIAAKGYSNGVKDGIEQGIKQGIEQGIEKGIEQGIEQGITYEKNNTAIAMLNENIDITIISKITGLTIEEIKKLKKSL